MLSGIGITELLIILICLIPIILGVIILVVYVIKKASSNNQSKPDYRIPCPHCAEMILPDAKICRYCGRELRTD